MSGARPARPATLSSVNRIRKLHPCANPFSTFANSWGWMGSAGRLCVRIFDALWYRAAYVEIEWPIDRALISSAVSARSTASPKPAPAMPIGAVKLHGGATENKRFARNGPQASFSPPWYFLRRMPESIAPSFRS